MKNFTTAQIETINSFYIRNIDKYFRMFAGLSSRLTRYDEDVIYLEIVNNQTHLLSTYNTAVVFAYKWKNHNPELNDAKGFVVIFKDSDSPQGFAFRATESPEKLSEKITRTLQKMKTEQTVIHAIFSGNFSKELESVEQDMA